MKLISEDEIRSIIEATNPKIYYIPPGKLLSPAARDYLNRQLIKIDVEKNRSINEAREAREAREAELQAKAAPQEPAAAEEPAVAEVQEAKPAPAPAVSESPAPRGYTDFETGAKYDTKPESMTQLFGRELVFKNDDRIRFRGKLDSLQAMIVKAQCFVNTNSKCEVLIRDLGDLLNVAREIMRADVLNDTLRAYDILGLSHEELRDQSHHPQKYFEIKNQDLPDYTFGMEFAMINEIRAAVREAEVVAVDAYMVNRKIERIDIVEELNRLSSAAHIMMLKCRTGKYRLA